MEKAAGDHYNGVSELGTRSGSLLGVHVDREVGAAA